MKFQAIMKRFGKYSLITCGLISLLSLNGCTTYRDMKSFQPEESVLIQSSYHATDALLKNIPQTSYGLLQPTIVTTLLDINNLAETSALGRLISEQVRTKLSNLGFNVIEFKVANNVFAKKLTGEIALSADLQRLAKTHKVSSVVVGTYTKSLHHVYINLKVVNPKDNQILSSYDYVLSLDPNIKQLITNPDES